jgi:hypothetical protein
LQPLPKFECRSGNSRASRREPPKTVLRPIRSLDDRLTDGKAWEAVPVDTHPVHGVTHPCACRDIRLRVFAPMAMYRTWRGGCLHRRGRNGGMRGRLGRLAESQGACGPVWTGQTRTGCDTLSGIVLRLCSGTVLFEHHDAVTGSGYSSCNRELSGGRDVHEIFLIGRSAMRTYMRE